MAVELVIATLALIVSGASFVFSIIAWRTQKDAGVTASTLQAFAQLERSIADVPTALRFHGITPKMLAEVRVTPEEFAYLVACFTTRYIYHYGVTPNKIQPASVGSYTYNLLKSPSTRNVWHLIKIMMGSGKYIDYVEATIKMIEDTECADN